MARKLPKVFNHNVGGFFPKFRAYHGYILICISTIIFLLIGIAIILYQPPRPPENILQWNTYLEDLRDYINFLVFLNIIQFIVIFLFMIGTWRVLRELLIGR